MSKVAPSEQTVYKLSTSGANALARPQGRVSPGFLHMLSKIDGQRTVAQLGELMPNLSPSDLKMWTGELARQGLIVATGPAATAGSTFEYDAFVEMDKDDEFNRTVESVRESLRRAQPQAEEQSLRTTARLVAMESKSSDRVITEKGFFAFPSHEGQGESAGKQPGDFLVLVVEDDAIQAHMALTIVAKEGYQTAVAADGNELLAYLKSARRPDLILMDVELPGGDGFDYLEKMRNHAGYRHQPVIMLTARSSRSDIARGIMLGANGYVTKPYKSELLRGAIRQTLNLV
jgi:CheY-like chemotaxis protein